MALTGPWRISRRGAISSHIRERQLGGRRSTSAYARDVHSVLACQLSVRLGNADWLERASHRPWNFRKQPSLWKFLVGIVLRLISNKYDLQEFTRTASDALPQTPVWHHAKQRERNAAVVHDSSVSRHDHGLKRPAARTLPH